MIDPAEYRRLAAIMSRPIVTVGDAMMMAQNASAIASALTDAAELAGKYADTKAIADLFCEEQATLTAERDAARVEVERLRAGELLVGDAYRNLACMDAYFRVGEVVDEEVRDFVCSHLDALRAAMRKFDGLT